MFSYCHAYTKRLKQGKTQYYYLYTSLQLSFFALLLLNKLVCFVQSTAYLPRMGNELIVGRLHITADRPKTMAGYVSQMITIECDVSLYTHNMSSSFHPCLALPGRHSTYTEAYAVQRLANKALFSSSRQVCAIHTGMSARV